MHWKTKRWIGNVLVTVVFSIIALAFLWKPGVSAQNEQEIDAKIKHAISKTLDPQARISYIHLDGFGASRKFRYAIVSYMLPEDDRVHTGSLYMDKTGRSFEPSARPNQEKFVYEDLPLLQEMDFSVVAANTRRIRDRFVEEGKEWMGISEYNIRFDEPTGSFEHHTTMYYETGTIWFKRAAEFIFGVTPGLSETYIIGKNGTGRLEKKE